VCSSSTECVWGGGVGWKVRAAEVSRCAAAQQQRLVAGCRGRARRERAQRRCVGARRRVRVQGQAWHRGARACASFRLLLATPPCTEHGSTEGMQCQGGRGTGTRGTRAVCVQGPAGGPSRRQRGTGTRGTRAMCVCRAQQEGPAGGLHGSERDQGGAGRNTVVSSLPQRLRSAACHAFQACAAVGTTPAAACTAGGSPSTADEA